MIVIGLTGSIAMGKSEVAKIWEAQGIPVFDSDREVHALYDSPAGANLLRKAAPQAVVGKKVDRSILSKLVMDDPDLLNKLEKIVHAEIAKRRAEFVATAEVQGHTIVVVDIPLLFESGSEKDADLIVVVSAPEAEQHRRALSRPGMTREKLDMILKRQMPDAEKRRRANFVIDNNGTLDELREKALDVLAAIRKDHAL